MPDPASYSWAMTIQNAVPVGDTITMPTPGMPDPVNYDTVNAQIVYGGEVLDDDEFTLAWASDFTSVVITNDSDEEWPPQDTIAIAVAGVPFDPSSLEESFTQIIARIQKLETEQETHDDQIIALETKVAALDASEFDPVVVSQTLSYVPISQLDPAVAVYTMSATNSPVTWAISTEELNFNPTTGYWVINTDTGEVFATPAGIAVFADGDTAVILMNATNQYTTSEDGFLWLTLRA